jgi:hypothetical protein
VTGTTSGGLGGTSTGWDPPGTGGIGGTASGDGI